MPARERVAAILVAIYAQPIVRVTRLTIDQIAVTGSETMSITLARTPLALPAPIGAAVRAWLDQRDATMPPLATPSPWLFPGNPRSMSDQQLSQRLKRFGIDCKRDRQAALLHLAGEMPAAILADVVGIGTRPRDVHGHRVPRLPAPTGPLSESVRTVCRYVASF
jgi:hypothetical protein